MRITSTSGDFVELRIAGYEFDPATMPLDFFEDANWLVIAGRVQRGAASWEFRQPCLLTTEAEALLRWLRGAADQAGEIEFLEPNLAFASAPGTDGALTLTVTLRDEAAPPHERARGELRMKFPLTLSVTKDALAAAAAEWEREVAAYPVRRVA